MSGKTKIEWTDVVWNPIRGCSKVGEGCRNCYALRMAARFDKPGYWGFCLTDSLGHWSGRVHFIREKLDLPSRWRKPRRIFVNSVSDLFHPAVTDVQIFGVLKVIGMEQRHTFQVLTKRPDRMLEFMNRITWLQHTPHAPCIPRIDLTSDSKSHYEGHTAPASPNLHLGVSVWDQKSADEFVVPLLQTPAALRWVSVEPVLGPVDLRQVSNENDEDCALYFPLDGEITCDGLNEPLPLKGGGLRWVVCGSETGPHKRRMDFDWARSLRDQCKAAGVPFFFKKDSDGNHTLDGVVHEEMPK